MGDVTQALGGIASWFGGNRMSADVPGRLLGACEIVFVPFAGGLSELPHIGAREIVAADFHADLINLARVVQYPLLRTKLVRMVEGLPFHPDVLAEAQATCRTFREVSGTRPAGLFAPIQYGPMSDEDRVSWAAAYYVVAWMGRSALAGTGGELRSGLAVRYNAGGGASSKRWRTAVAGITQWGEWIANVAFQRMDCFELLARAENDRGVGIYCDPPWPEDGDRYVHAFTPTQQKRLADVLRERDKCRIVVRINDHPLSRELYEGWMERLEIKGRTQANTAKAEVVFHQNCEGGARCGA
ncbi:MAG: hypothetical protein AAF593_01225 [Planctomycetota bacterium]